MVIMDDGIALQADLDMPENPKEKMPVVVLIHGLTGWRTERHILAVAKAFNECGYAVLRADMYGHGESGGEFRNHTLFKWMNNAMTLVDYARALPFADRVFLAGHSQGGLMAMLTAALKRDVISGLVPMSPACMIPEECRNGRLLFLGFDPENIPDVVCTPDGREFGGNYFRVAQTIHVEDAIDKYTGPVLLIHGDADEAVPYHYGAEAASRYRNCEFVTIPGDDHCYNHHLDQVVTAVKDWAKRQL